MGMKFNWDEALVDFDGKEINIGGDEKDKAWSLGLWSRAALSATFKNETEISGDELFKRGKLARKINDNLAENKASNARRKITPDDEFTSDEIQLAKKCIGKMGQPIFLTQCWELLDNPIPKEVKGK